MRLFRLGLTGTALMVAAAVAPAVAIVPQSASYDPARTRVRRRVAAAPMASRRYRSRGERHRRIGRANRLIVSRRTRRRHRRQRRAA